MLQDESSEHLAIVSHDVLLDVVRVHLLNYGCRALKSIINLAVLFQLTLATFRLVDSGLIIVVLTAILPKDSC